MCTVRNVRYNQFNVLKVISKMFLVDRLMSVALSLVIAAASSDATSQSVTKALVSETPLKVQVYKHCTPMRKYFSCTAQYRCPWGINS